MNQYKAEKTADLFNDSCRRYNITSYDVVHEFMANLLHESGGFTILVENLNYSTPQRLVAVWPSRFTTTSEAGKRNAASFTNEPQKLANLVYGGRMGNTLPNDGWTFRGGGYAQLTGRDAYTLYTQHVNIGRTERLTIQQVANLVQTDEVYAMDSAFWFFCIFKNLEQLAIQDNFRELVRRWNGGWVGMEDRVRLYNLCQQILK
jgi:putative chitinase